MGRIYFICCLIFAIVVEICKSLTGEIGTWIHSQLRAVIFVVSYTLVYGVCVTTVTFNGTIDSLDCCSESLSRGDGGMTVAVLHPKPNCCLERNGGVICYLLRLIQPVESNVLSCWAIVEVPATLKHVNIKWEKSTTTYKAQIRIDQFTMIVGWVHGQSSPCLQHKDTQCLFHRSNPSMHHSSLQCNRKLPRVSNVGGLVF